MFNGMYDLMNKLKKKPINQTVALQKNPTAILSAQELLSTEKRQQILSDIRTLLSLTNEEYDKIFLSVIHRFAEFVQNLPETERSFYASLGGMIDHALERASLSLFLARTYLLPEGTTLSSVSEEEMLWVYAIFTASLLLDVGKIPTRHVVSLTDEPGNIIEAWNAYAGSMEKKGSITHYVFGFMDDHNDNLRWKVTPLLARQIIPVDGFNWLASNEEVLQAWLGLLSDDQSEMGWLKVIPLADAQILESYFSDRKVFRHSLSPQTIAMINKILKERKDAQKRQKELGEKLLNAQAEKGLDIKGKKEDSKTKKDSLFASAVQTESLKDLAKAAKEAKEANIDPKQVVDQFVKWLQKETQDNKSQVLNTTEGALITRELLDKFVSENKNAGVDTQKLQTILMSLDVVSSLGGPRDPNPAVMTINPYIAFPIGPPPVASIVQAQQVLQAAQQNQQQQDNTQEQKPPVHTPTPYNTTAKR